MESNLFAFQSRKLNSSTTWLLFIFLGWSYGSMGKMGKQILYWFTLGGFGLWFFYVLVNLGDRIKQYNYELAMELGLTDEEMRMMGVVKISTPETIKNVEGYSYEDDMRILSQALKDDKVTQQEYDTISSKLRSKYKV